MHARSRGRGRSRRWRAAWPLAALLLVSAWGARAPQDRVPPRRHEVEIRGMAFHPAVLAVAPGDTVVWVNRDLVPHTATAAGNPGWDTGPLAQGDSGRFVPRQRDVMSYVCTLHPTMRGRLIVGARAATPARKGPIRATARRPPSRRGTSTP